MTPGPPPVMTVKPSRASAGPDPLGQRVVGMVLLEAGRAEDRDARADEVQRPKPADELPHDLEDGEELLDRRERGPERKQPLRSRDPADSDPSATGASGRPSSPLSGVGCGPSRQRSAPRVRAMPKHRSLRSRQRSDRARRSLASGGDGYSRLRELEPRADGVEGVDAGGLHLFLGLRALALGRRGIDLAEAPSAESARTETRSPETSAKPRGDREGRRAAAAAVGQDAGRRAA